MKALDSVIIVVEVWTGNGALKINFSFDISYRSICQCLSQMMFGQIKYNHVNILKPSLLNNALHFIVVLHLSFCKNSIIEDRIKLTTGWLSFE